MPKTPSYHRAAIEYNEKARDFFAELATQLTSPVTKKWAKSNAKQHDYHVGRHKNFLTEALSEESETSSADVISEDVAITTEKNSGVEPAVTVPEFSSTNSEITEENNA